MNSTVLFYSQLCPDTQPFIDELQKLDITYECVDIFESMANFKRFLCIRDTNAHFDESKRLGNAGIPALVIDDKTVILSREELKNYNIMSSYE